MHDTVWPGWTSKFAEFPEVTEPFEQVMLLAVPVVSVTGWIPGAIEMAPDDFCWPLATLSSTVPFEKLNVVVALPSL